MLTLEPRMIIIFWACSPLSLEHVSFWYPYSEPSIYLNPHTTQNMRWLNKKGNQIKGGGCLPYLIRREHITNIDTQSCGVVSTRRHMGHPQWGTVKRWWGYENGICHCISPHLCWLLNLEWLSYYEHIVRSLLNMYHFGIRSRSHDPYISIRIPHKIWGDLIRKVTN